MCSVLKGKCNNITQQHNITAFSNGYSVTEEENKTVWIRTDRSDKSWFNFRTCNSDFHLYTFSHQFRMNYASAVQLHLSQSIVLKPVPGDLSRKHFAARNCFCQSRPELIQIHWGKESQPTWKVLINHSTGPKLITPLHLVNLSGRKQSANRFRKGSCRGNLKRILIQTGKQDRISERKNKLKWFILQIIVFPS